MEDLSWVESRTFVALYHCVLVGLIVATATTVIGAAIVFAIEGLETTARNVRGWLKKPRLWA